MIVIYTSRTALVEEVQLEVKFTLLVVFLLLLLLVMPVLAVLGFPVLLVGVREVRCYDGRFLSRAIRHSRG